MSAVHMPVFMFIRSIILTHSRVFLMLANSLLMIVLHTSIAGGADTPRAAHSLVTEMFAGP